MASLPYPDRPDGSVSVVICTRNRPDKIGASVEHVLANDHPNFTLTVIDQSDDDRTGAVVRAIADGDGRLSYYHINEVGLSRAYNRGITLTDGEIIAFTDDDCVAPADWIRTVEAAFVEEPDADLLYGQVVPLEEGDESGLTPNLQFDRPERLSRADGFRVFGMGANFAARRRLFDAIGGFDEIMGGGGALKSSQDYDLAYRSYCADRVVILRPEVIMRHDGRRESADWPALLANYGFGDGAFYAKHVRCRDPYALWLLARQAGMTTARLAKSALQRRPVDPAYLVGLGRGLKASLAFDVDVENRLYSDRPVALDEERVLS